MQSARLLLPAVAFFAALFVGCASEAPAPCVAGARGCPCGAGSTCDDGLVCEPGTQTCAGAREVTLPSIDPAARSCELVLVDDGAHVVGVEFDASIHGETIRQAPRTAVTFYANADAPIARASVRIALAGDGQMTITRARCFDGAGHVLPSAIASGS